MKVTATCTNGHTQTLEVVDMDKEWVVEWAKLMDGTSDFFQSSPREDAESFIGKCGICGALFDCTVEEEG